MSARSSREQALATAVVVIFLTDVELGTFVSSWLEKKMAEVGHLVDWSTSGKHKKVGNILPLRH